MQNKNILSGLLRNDSLMPNNDYMNSAFDDPFFDDNNQDNNMLINNNFVDDNNLMFQDDLNMNMDIIEPVNSIPIENIPIPME